MVPDWMRRPSHLPWAAEWVAKEGRRRLETRRGWGRKQ